MRTEKELFELMLEHQNLFPHGLCDWVFLLFTSDIICRDERNLLENYLAKNKPDGAESFWWEADKIQPRLDWINQQIEKL